MAILVKRAYEPAADDDGRRVLVDRLWPRGLKKEDLGIELWLKEVAPSNELRSWYGHDPAKWPEFKRRYFGELDHKTEEVTTLLKLAEMGTVTLLFSSRELQLNNAVALKEYLERKLPTERH